jgi:hypothetical protein
MSIAVLIRNDGLVVDVPVDRVEIVREDLGVRLVDEDLGLGIFVPITGTGPFVFEVERRAPHPKDDIMSLDEVTRALRNARS